MNRLFEVDVEVSQEQKSKIFLKKLQGIGFISKNKNHLSRYLSKDLKINDKTGIALSHIKKEYINLVLNGSWSERKYVDITFLLAKDRKLFIKTIYCQYGEKYNNRELNDAVLAERAKYK